MKMIDKIHNLPCRGLTPANEEKPVLIPGDPEKTREKNVERTRGVIYSGAQFRRFVQIR